MNKKYLKYPNSLKYVNKLQKESHNIILPSNIWYKQEI